ncbi:MAG: DMT family transporter [Thermoanaerobaculia bacterium]|nr:DMT family transporter [Thermoanaerobaculia bacterium]
MSNDPASALDSRAAATRGMLLFVASSSLFGLMAFIAKLASARIPGSEVAMIRFAVGLVPILLITRIRRRSFEWTRFDLLLIRGFFGGTAVLFYFLAIAHIPVGVATLLNYLSPVFAGIYAAAFAGEPLRARIVVPLFVALVGVWLVVGAQGNSSSVLGFGKWELVGLLSAVCSGAAVTAIRVARRTENSWAIFSSFSIFGVIVTAPFAIWNWIPPTPYEWFLLTLVGIVSIAAQMLMTHAFRWVQTLIAGVISQMGVVVAMLLGAVFLAEKLTPRSLLGTAITLAGVVAVMVVSNRPVVDEIEP